MKVIIAPETYKPSRGECPITVFLGGGITGCSDWQSKVIEELENLSSLYNMDDVVIFNPRREDFDISDPGASIEQIEWEHKYLKDCDVFTMYFEASDSPQPICMYELGKHQSKDRTAITVQKGYLREEDVLIQSKLDGRWVNYVAGDEAISVHARYIAYQIYWCKLLKESMERSRR